MCLASVALVLSAAIVIGCTDRQKEPGGSSSAGTTATSSPAKPATMPSPPKPPDVPPLEPGEIPPVRGPNYFEPHEMGTTGIATAYKSCMESLEQTDAGMLPWQAVPYCACIADAWRSNIHASGDPDSAPKPSKDQLKKCLDLDGGAGPYAVPFPKDTPSLFNSWKTCVDKFTELDHGVYCGCYTDGVFKNPSYLTLAPADDKRCILADQYYAATKKHLTVHQFQGLVGMLLGDVPDAGHSFLRTR
jgi:hypothetical protein